MFKRYSSPTLDQNFETSSESSPPRAFTSSVLDRESQTTSQEEFSRPQKHFIKEKEEKEPETHISKGSFFKGTLDIEGVLRIDGTFEGEIVSQGSLFIGPCGVVRADLDLKEVVIEGSVEGNIQVDGRLELRCGASVNGNIQAKILSVDEGVSLNGFVSVQREEELSEYNQDQESLSISKEDPQENSDKKAADTFSTRASREHALKNSLENSHQELIL